MPTPSKWFLINNPTIYQGWNKTNNYFEGWYFKVVDPKQNLAFALIPGISKSTDSHAFIQFIDGVNCKSKYFRYDDSAFSAEADKFEIKIEDNLFSESQIYLKHPEIDIDLSQSPYVKLKPSLLQPGIMGWYSYTPFMQCYHGLVSMNHTVSGHIRLGTKKYILDSAKCYVEKDWGVSFPKAWIWNQCNNFKEHEELSVFASVAHIPWMGSFFIGHIAAIYFNGNIEIFASYNRSKRQTTVDDNKVEMIFRKGNKTLKIQSVKEAGADLKSPLKGAMLSKVNESLLAEMNITYQIGSQVIVSDTGSFAGMELAGPVDILLK